MSNGNHGLRFDIYERVHLPDNVAAIDELEEIELVPRIQVIEQGDNAILQGQLVLNGIYRAQGTEDEQVALEHWIPVEITLPLNRITRLDEVTVDIDTFDVVLLSSRALNLTGILSLRGIVLEQEQEPDEWDAEVFTVSHSRGEEEDSEDNAVSFSYDEQQNYEGRSYEAQEQEQEQYGQQYEAQQYGVQYEQQYQEQYYTQQDERPAAEQYQGEELNAEGQYSGDEGYAASEQSNEQPTHLSFLQQLEQRYGQQSEQQENEGQQFVQQSYHEQQYVQQVEQQYVGYRVDEQEDADAELEDSNDAPVLESTSYLASLSTESALQQEEQGSREEWDQSELQAEQSEQDAYDTAQQQAEEEAQWSSWETVETEGAREPEEQNFQDDQLQQFEPEVEASGQSLAEPPIQRELHIALNGNKEQNEVQGIRTILNSSLREQAAQQAATIQQQEQDRKRDEQEKQRSHEEQIEWQQLFLNKRPEQNEFKRIRMCIVQKEDTLELIATRYSVNPRELLLRNNLHESAITEGQLLYIP